MVMLRGTLLFLMLLVCQIESLAYAQDDFSNEVEGYLEPYQKIDVSTVETGIIDSIQIKEGAIVTSGQVLVRLRRLVLEKSLAVAKQEFESVGNLKTARAELELQKKRLEILKGIYDRGHGRTSELNRALADVEVAKGRVLQAEELITIKRKEIEQIKSRIAARDIHSPIDGIVVEIHKNPGEAVSPNNPILITVVNIDQLKCVLDVPRQVAHFIRTNQSIVLESDSSQEIVGEVQWKSPIVNAESETVKVVIRIDNPNGAYTSGEHCILSERTQFADLSIDGKKGQTVSYRDLRGSWLKDE